MEDLFRKVIRKKLYESLQPHQQIINENSTTSSKKNEQEEYINKRLAIFNEEIKKIALENNYPNISDCLDEAIKNLKNSIGTGVRYAYNWNELLLH